MNQRSKNIALFFQMFFCVLYLHLFLYLQSFSADLQLTPAPSWPWQAHRLGHRPHPLRKLQLQVESHTKIAIQAARPGVARHIGEGVAVTLPHDLHRAKPSFWLEHCCQLLLPVRAVNVGKLQWEHANFMLQILQKQQWFGEIPILTDLFRSWGPVEEGEREEITYDLTNLTWQVGS